MISGLDATLHTVLSELSKDSETTYHLTGSRCFGTNVPSSDYDFCTSRVDPEFLARLGFVKADLGEKNYSNAARHKIAPLVELYRHPARVDIQVRRDLNLFLMAQTILLHLCQFSGRAPTNAEWSIALNAAMDLEKQFELQKRP